MSDTEHSIKKSIRFISRVPFVQLLTVDSARPSRSAICPSVTFLAFRKIVKVLPQALGSGFGVVIFLVAFMVAEGRHALLWRVIPIVLTGDTPVDTLRINMRKIKPKPALRQFRRQQKLRAKDVAVKLGVSESTLRSYENGHREVDGDMAVHMEKRLGIPRGKLRSDLFIKRAA